MAKHDLTRRALFGGVALASLVLAAHASRKSDASVGAAFAELAETVPAETPVEARPATESWIPDTSGEMAAAGLAAGGLVSALIALVGPNRFLNWIAAVGTGAAKAAGKAARTAGTAVAKTVKAPGRLLLLIGGLSLFALTGIALFDVQWQAGLAAGAALTAACGYGWHKGKGAVAGLAARLPDIGRYWTGGSPQEARVPI